MQNRLSSARLRRGGCALSFHKGPIFNPFANFFQHSPKGRVGGDAHSSIRIQEGQPSSLSLFSPHRDIVAGRGLRLPREPLGGDCCWSGARESERRAGWVEQKPQITLQDRQG